MWHNCKICGKEDSALSWESSCYLCSIKKKDEDIKSEILKGERDCTECENKIYCPYCGEEYEQIVEVDADLDYEGEYERECGFCDKEFTIYVNVLYSYDTNRKESTI